MHYPRFLFYNILSGLLWPVIFVFCGYFSGNILFMKKYFWVLIMAIVIISAIPLIIGAVIARLKEQDKQNISLVSDDALW